jgi:hypothetical protein
MQDNKDYLKLYYNFVSTVKLDDRMAGALGGWGEYRPLDRNGIPGNDTVRMMYSDIAFADRLYTIATTANEHPGVSLVAAWAKDPDEEPRATPAPPVEPVKEPDWAGMFISAGKDNRWVRLLSYMRAGCSWSDAAEQEDNLERLVLEVIGKLAKSRKHAILFDCTAARIQEIVSRVSWDIREHAADDFFGKALPGFADSFRKVTGIITPENASVAAYRFLYGRIRNLALKYARAYMYTYGPNLAPEEMTLPEDIRWADSHRVLPMLPAILLDIDNAVRFRMMVLTFGTAGKVTYSALGVNPVVTEDSLERNYPALNRLCILLVTEIVRGTRAGDYFDPRDTDSSNDAREDKLRDYSLRFLYRKLSGGLLPKDVAMLREAVDAQFAARNNVLKPHGRDDAQLRRCMAFLRRMARVAVMRAIYELKKGGREGVERKLAKPLQL